MLDIVFPKNNEEEFLALAKRLGWKGLVYVYDNPHKIPQHLPEGCHSGLLTTEKDVLAAKKRASLVLVKSTGEDRRLFERVNPNIIYGLEEVTTKDFIHHRASGLNHVLAKLAYKNNIHIGFAFQRFLQYEGKWRGLILGRLMQNIILCRKSHAHVCIGTFARNPHELRAPQDLANVYTLLGMTDKEVKTALHAVENIIHGKPTR